MKARLFFSSLLVTCALSVMGSGKPNIIMIVADDLGYHDPGCYGQQLIKTPNIDKLASESMRFTQFYAGAAVCAPSRSVLQSGLNTGHTTVRGNQCRAGGLLQPPGSQGRPGTMRIGIPVTDTTIGTLMQKAGYRTALIGKWHLSGYRIENTPHFRGYDDFYGHTLAEPSRRGYMFHNDKTEKIPEEFLAESGDGTYTNLAIDYIKNHRNETFMLLLNLSTPHKPFNISDQGIYSEEPWNDMTRNYAALVTRLDRHVGMIMQALAEEDLEDKTILMFCSDNGGEYREYPEDWAEWTTTIQSNRPLRGGKADLYEGGIRVPVIVRWPGVTETASISDQPLYFADIMPTFLEIAGSGIPDWCDGVSMAGILTGDKDKLDDRFMYWEFEHAGFTQAVRWQDWKLIRYSVKKKRIYGQEVMDDRRRSLKYPGYELYNLKDDIAEEHNVIEANPEVANFILDYLKTARTESVYYPLTVEEGKNLDQMNAIRFE